jgi:hypothetical protein
MCVFGSRTGDLVSEFHLRQAKWHVRVQVSSVHPTEVACLQELPKRLQGRHVDCAEALVKKAAADAVSAATVNPGAPNVLQAMNSSFSCLAQRKSGAHAA